MEQKEITINYNGVDHLVQITITYSENNAVVKAVVGETELEFMPDDDDEMDIIMTGKSLDAELYDLIEAEVMRVLEDKTK